MVWYNPSTWFAPATADDSTLPATDPYAVDQAPPAFGGKRRKTRRGRKGSRRSRVGKKSSRRA